MNERLKNTENENDINIIIEESKNSNEKNIKQILKILHLYIKSLKRYKYKLVIINVFVLFLSVLYLYFIAEPKYESTVTILPEFGNNSANLSGLSGLAAFAGLNLAQKSNNEIYETLIQSGSVLKPVIYAEYNTEKYSTPVDLIDYFEIEPDDDLTPPERSRKMFLDVYEEMLKDRLNIELNKITKVLSLTVQMPESKLSADVVNKLTESLDNYIKDQRRSFASEQRKYLEKRILQVKDSLAMYENDLSIFLSKNRVITGSPSLMLTQSRLAREIEIKQTMYLELVKQLELAKIEEIKDAPVINVKESAEEPVDRAGAKIPFLLVFILILSFLITSTIAAFSHSIAKYKEYYLSLK